MCVFKLLQTLFTASTSGWRFFRSIRVASWDRSTILEQKCQPSWLFWDWRLVMRPPVCRPCANRKPVQISIASRSGYFPPPSVSFALICSLASNITRDQDLVGSIDLCTFVKSAWRFSTDASIHTHARTRNIFFCRFRTAQCNPVSKFTGTHVQTTPITSQTGSNRTRKESELKFMTADRRGAPLR